MAGAEDKATQGCDLSADPGAEMGRERAQLAPPVQTNLGTKAINPKPPDTDPLSLLLLPQSPSPRGTLNSHGSFIKLLTEPAIANFFVRREDSSFGARRLCALRAQNSLNTEVTELLRVLRVEA